MPSEVTRGVRVSVQAIFLPNESMPPADRYVFAYTVEIKNVGDQPVRLQSRHWVITDALGQVEEVRGPGVIGQTPSLAPGESFAYTSGSVLRTEWGTMSGEYQMEDPDGRIFDVVIPSFMLAGPGRLFENIS